MSQMTVVRAHRFGGAEVLDVERIARPTPGAGEILIRVESASVNFSDVMRRRADNYPLPTVLPFVPGSEVAGRVEALGDGVNGPAVGTPVFALVGVREAMGTTGYAQYTVANASQVVPIPPGMDADTACGMFVAGLTAMLIVRDIARVSPGDRVLVQGAGGAVGQYAVQLARHFGAELVIGAASTEEKRTVAAAAGAHVTIDSASPDWSDEVARITPERGLDVILEMTGGDSVERGLGLLAPFGRVVVFGSASGVPLRLSADAIVRFFYAPALNQSLLVFNLGMWFVNRPDAVGSALQSLVALLSDGTLQAPSVVQLPLSAARDAHALLESRKSVGKIVLKPWSDVA